MNRSNARPEVLARVCTPLRLVALALFGLACGPPKLTGDADAGNADAENESSGGSSGSSSSTTSSSSETGTHETTTDSGETWGFVPIEDMWELNECDPVAQDCPDGEKCVPYSSVGDSWDGSKCVPVLGDQSAGEPCTYAGTVESTDDCDATSFCWEVNQDGAGTCRLFCTGTLNTPECPEGSSCLFSNSLVIFLCIPACDPILQDCAGGLACYWANNGFECIFTTQDIPPGEPCGFFNDCVEGNGCLDAEYIPGCNGSACCSPFCDLQVGDAQCE
jgi:hypothetical protein